MKNLTTPTMILASAQAMPDTILATAVEVNIEAAGDGEAASKLPTFDMLLYTGGLLSLSGWYAPMVVDLQGVKPISSTITALRQHDPLRVVGHCDKVDISAKGITVKGVISGVGADANEVRETSRRGVPWQASMGARAIRKEFVEAGKSVTVNGRQFAGPLYVSRETELFEASFVVLGADTNTSASVAAAAPTNNQEGNNMDFAQRLRASYSLDAATLNPEQKAKFEAAFAESQKVQASAPATSVQASGHQSASDINAGGMLTIEQIRAEGARIDAIRAACKDHPDISAQAIKEGWNVDKAENHAMKAAHAATANNSGVTSAPMINCGASNVAGSELVEAAAVGLSLRCGVQESELKASDKVMAAGYQFRNKTLVEICAMAAQAEGVPVHFGMSKEEVFRAAASTKSLSAISRSVSSRSVLKGWMIGTPSWRSWCSTGNLPDFKLNEKIGLYSALSLKELAKDGTIADGSLSGAKEVYRAIRYARGINIDEQTIINDDLSVLSTLPEKLGLKGAQKVSGLVYTHLLLNPSMRDDENLFSAKHGNLKTSSALSVDSVEAAIAALRKMVDEESETLDIEPFALLVPPELEQTARNIVESPAIIVSSSTKMGVNNTIAGYKLKVIVEPRLSNSSYAGSSASAWYLLGNPAQGETVEVGFVNGVQNPVVEQMPTAPNQYGIYLRTKLDVGVKALDWRGMILNQA